MSIVKTIAFQLVFIINLAVKAQDTKLPPSFVVDSISVSGNTHTKAFIIIRELTFKRGDTISHSQWIRHAEQSRRQIINLYLFNEASVEADSSGHVHIKVTERWYFWPQPVVEIADRNFNQWWLTKDFTRLLYGARLKWFNVRGRNETLYLTAYGGYTHNIDISYRIPYINRSKTLGITIAAGNSNNKEVWYKTSNNRVQFFKDADRVLITRHAAELGLQYRRRIFAYHNAGAGFRRIRIADTVISKAVNESFLADNMSKQDEWYQYYMFTHDNRDIKGYAFKGHIFRIALSNILLNPSLDSRSLIFLKGSYTGYLPMGGRWFAAAGGTARWCSAKQLPYNNIRALGYNSDYIRGYELYVIDGPSYLLGKSSLKYRCLNKVITTKHMIKNYRTMPLSLFLTAFYDAGYVYNYQTIDYNNTMINSLQYGYGIGADLVLFYNNVARIEYALNKFGENRVYLHFIAAL